LNSDFLEVSHVTAKMQKIFRQNRAWKNWGHVLQFVSTRMNLFKQLADATKVRKQLL